MDVHVTGRAGGKTFQTVQWLRDHPDGALVCGNAHTADRLIMENPDLADRIFNTRVPRKQVSQFPRLAVDDADALLAEVFGRTPDRISVTGRPVRGPSPAEFLPPSLVASLKARYDKGPDVDPEMGYHWWLEDEDGPS